MQCEYSYFGDGCCGVNAGISDVQREYSYFGGRVDSPATCTKVRCGARLTNVGPHT